ncbi:MAG: flagellar export chaperone FliS [Candidatus Sumerlaeia bacterium]
MGTALSKAYLLTKVLTASKIEVIVYLYEGAIGYLHRAAEALREGRRAQSIQFVDRALHIIIELSGSLNYTTGGQMALRLDTIYNHLIESLTLANARADLEAIESCEGILVILHGAWQQAAASDEHVQTEEPHQLRVSA